MTYRPGRRAELTIEEFIRQLLEQTKPRFNTRANDSVIFSQAESRGVTTIVETGPYSSRARLLKIIDELADQRKIMYAPAVAAALQAAKERHPHYNFNFYAAEKRVLDKAEELKFDITSAADLGDLMEWMISEPTEAVPLSSFGRRSQQLQAEAKQRAQFLNNILQDRNTYPKWDGRHGKVIAVDAHTLESKTNEELAQIEREVNNLRRQMGMSREQQQETLHQFANKNRVGYDPQGNKIVGFENRPQSDSLDGAAAKPYSDNPTASPIAARVDIRSYQANAKVDYNGPHDANKVVSANDPFIVACRELAKAEVRDIALNNLQKFRELLRKDVNRLNRILGV